MGEGERERNRTRGIGREKRGLPPPWSLWFVAQRSQATSNSYVTFFPLLQASVNRDLGWTSPDSPSSMFSALI